MVDQGTPGIAVPALLATVVIPACRVIQAMVGRVIAATEGPVIVDMADRGILGIQVYLGIVARELPVIQGILGYLDIAQLLGIVAIPLLLDIAGIRLFRVIRVFRDIVQYQVILGTPVNQDIAVILVTLVIRVALDIAG